MYLVIGKPIVGIIIIIVKSKARQNQYKVHRYSHLSFIVFFFYLFYSVCFCFCFFFIIRRRRCVVVGNGRFKRSIYSDSNIWTTTPQPGNPPTHTHTTPIALPLPTQEHTPPTRDETRNRETYEIGGRECYLYQQVCVRSHVTHVDTRPTSNLFPSSDDMCVAVAWSAGRGRKRVKKKREKRKENEI